MNDETTGSDSDDTAAAVKAGDDLAREAAGRDHPEEGHDVRDYRPIDTSQAVGPDQQAAENLGDDSAVDEHGNEVDTVDDAEA